jgi:TetR/AcrR family transcriptional regulator
VTTPGAPTDSWVERAVERSAAVQRSRVRIAAQVRQILDAARKLIGVKGEDFTTQELVVEAGVALQTFYRYFASKDELVLAVIGDAMVDSCERLVRDAAALSDPLARLRYYLTATLDRLDENGQSAATSRFIVSMRWRLHRYFPNELAQVERPFVELLRSEVDAATEAGLLMPRDPQWDSWLVTELVRSVFHFYAFAPHADGELEITKDRLWRFCLAALGGTVQHQPARDVKGVLQ